MIPWNKNKSVGQKKPFTPRQIEMLKEFLGNAGKVKELALFCLGIDSMLRCSDLLKLKVEDISDYKGKIKTTIQLKQKKTRQGHQVRIGKSAIKALEDMIRKEKKFEDDFLFTTNICILTGNSLLPNCSNSKAILSISSNVTFSSFVPMVI